MGFSKQRFMDLPPATQAKKLADLLRVILLRLGADWRQALAEYDALVEWSRPPEKWPELKLGESLRHPRLVDLYLHWRGLAGLGPERDVYLQQDPGDLDAPKSSPLPWSALLHNIRSAYNVGSVIRSVDCFGLGTVHFSGYTPSTAHASLRSASRGCEAWIPVKRWESPLECIAAEREAGGVIVALETGPDAVNLRDFHPPARGMVLLGNEELGLAPELLALADTKVHIPMYGRKASLNVASAFAILASTLRDACP